MRLIGMMDSPYVRRVAVSLKLMGLPFEQSPLSVFRNFEAFAAINPVVKAPTLVADDGTVLLDSTLILEYLDRLAPTGRRLNPVALPDFLRCQRLTGLALAACEKAVQIVYERNLRPGEKQHEPWVDRVRGQLLAAWQVLEKEVAPAKGWLIGDRPLQADVTVAVAWRFSRFALPDIVEEGGHPALTRFSARAEALPEFASCPLE
ncbi:glutathione S-transferase [Azospirillum thermophilum]|uniref:Glutathione S-transferase n=1 Tax=Azospirillum thermophilum TaxID=2202148 RepID=A0A2S2CVJ8_9PROT|nr:glutathione S-transferase [Azospirillum thermophilum]AWK88435.1 glutathione S-transferase [Azospirillum thermophilum]